MSSPFRSCLGVLQQGLLLMDWSDCFQKVGVNSKFLSKQIVHEINTLKCARNLVRTLQENVQENVQNATRQTQLLGHFQGYWQLYLQHMRYNSISGFTVVCYICKLPSTSTVYTVAHWAAPLQQLGIKCLVQPGVLREAGVPFIHSTHPDFHDIMIQKFKMFTSHMFCLDTNSM